MKKLLFYAVAAITALGAGCSKDVEGLDVPAAEGKYTLPAITASLDDAETRTAIGTNSVVNWSNNDRIAVVNTATNTIYYYVLVQGAGTPVGQFKPVVSANMAKFDDIDDIKAVYPAVAASVTGNKISVTINEEHSEAKRVAAGITSWTPNSSAYAFTHNDIKVSYKTSADFTSGNSQAKANFKFRQLGTWCNFVFNFTTSDKDYYMESMESIRVMTVSGKKMISGTAEVDFTDPNQPTLKEGTEASVEWKTSGTLSSATLTKSLMLFPVIDGDKLKVEVKTNLHTFTFYATPSQAFAAGTILRFPFNVDSNFKASDEMADFTYSAVENGNIPEFVYYGTANCLLLAGSNANGDELDITPYKTNAYWRLTGDKVDEGSTELYAATAEVIWREKDIETIDVAVSGDKKTLTVSNVTGYGNALVGIYNADNKLLWSYHVWKPEIDPTVGLLRYGYTNSGEYEVMPIALGATNKVDIGPTETATANTAKTFGYYYQWGRKDPLGRPGKLTGTTLVETVDKDGNAINFTDATRQYDISKVLGGDAVEEMEVDGKKVPVDYYMIKYTSENPTHFIAIQGTKYNGDWVGKTNDHLWGNPQGYNNPRGESLHRSIFEPCPAGYRVAPKDLWIAFTKSGGSFEAKMDDEANWAENNFNIANRVAGTTDWPTTKNTASLEAQRGYFFYYGINTDGMKKWQEGEYDFYPASGFRNIGSGSLSNVGFYGYSWSSSPHSAGLTTAGHLLFNTSNVNPLNSGSHGYARPVRCVKEQY